MSSVTGAFTLDDIGNALRDHERALAKYGDSMALEQVARTRRWLDEGDQRSSFAQAAADLERAITTNDTASPDSWAMVGGLWHLAGEQRQARRTLKNAVAGGTDWEPTPQGAAGVLYLLGELDRAARLAPANPEGWMAAGARYRDIEPVRRARERLLEWERLEKSGPHLDRSPVPLSAWDWIEESYRLEAEIRDEHPPSHLEMLRSSGLLRELDEPTEPAPPWRPPRPGFVAVLGAGGDDTPRLEVVDDDLVTVDLKPQRVLDFRRHDNAAGWGVRISDGLSSGEWILSPSEPDFQGAAGWAANWLKLRGEPRAAEDLRRLVAAHEAED